MSTTNEAKIRVTIEADDAVVNIKKMGKQIEQSMQKAKKEAEKTKNSFAKIGDLAQKFYFSFQSLKIIKDTIQDLSTMALKAADVKNAFKDMAQPGLLNELRTNVKGTVDDFTLMQKSVEAIDLGATEDQLKTFAEFARLEALRKGGDTATRFSEIISGVMRGSTELLDNFGISLTQLNGKLLELSGGKALNAVEMRSLKVEAAVQIMSERMKEFGDVALTDAEKAKQFAATLENAKLAGGQLLNLFLMPLIELVTPISQGLQLLNDSTKMMIGTVGIAIATLWKLIPALKAIGITSKFALGPIGLVIAALELFYTAYKTNFLGARDAIKKTWEYIKGFWNFIKNWAKSFGELFSSVGKIIKYAFTGQFSKIVDEFKNITGMMKDNWTSAFDGIKEKTDQALITGPNSVVKQFRTAGVQARKMFQMGLTGTDNVSGGVRGVNTEFELPFVDKIRDAAVAIRETKSAWDGFKTWIFDTQIMAFQLFDVIQSGMQALSRRLVDALLDTKTKFKDIWEAMAKDFLTIFVEELMRMLAQRSLISGLFSGLFSALMGGLGSIFSGFLGGGAGAGAMDLTWLFFGLGKNGGSTPIVREMKNQRSELKAIRGLLTNLKGPTVINQIGSRQLYTGMKTEREVDLIRRGGEINRSFF